jgi:uncharacterized FAD-dependent dehydrogenase
MRKEIELRLSPSDAANSERVKAIAAAQCGLQTKDIDQLAYLRRSIDARGSQPCVQLKLEIFSGERTTPVPALLECFKMVDQSKAVLVIGAGPAGYFAALELIELGLKPIVLDRGKDVQARRRDLRAIQQFGQVHPDSNYCFGEGGAGTYSDGKLYTRSHKRGSIEKALRLFVEHGADASILVDAYPHIGSNKLPQIVANLRATIEKFGGEVHFNTRVTDFILRDQVLKGVITNNNNAFYAEAVVLATGHSARDIYELLTTCNIKIEAKPFALGVRIEHPQALIDSIQYKQPKREEHLPPSSYKLVSQIKNRGVFSFCMCPGGLIVPAATRPGEIVVNGMSMSRRDSLFANSGTVVAVELEDLKPFQAKFGPLAALKFQEMVETTLFQFGDGSQQAPAQRLTDFVHQKLSSNLPKTSYIPGVYAAPLHKLLPENIYTYLRQGIKDFGQKMRGYYTEEAVVVGTESRTSAPVRIPRDNVTLMHEQVTGLFPCGEGAGYAGGIISAAMDGQNVAKAVAKFMAEQ